MKHSALEAPPWVYDRLALGSADKYSWQDEPWHAETLHPEPCAGQPRDERPINVPIRIETRRISGPSCTLLSWRVADAVDLPAPLFEQVCEDIYRRLDRALDEPGPKPPHNQMVRLWNFIPQILDPLGKLEHRYMVFNSGRYRALSSCLRHIEQVATASGVGHFDRDFVVHCLTTPTPGRAVENPRQIPAYRYSKRFGPHPPCFARATRLADPDEKVRDPKTPPRWLLVGGTAAVRGEDSLFPDDFSAQLEETLLNLAAVTRAGFQCKDPDPCPKRALATFESLRVYLVREQDRSILEETLRNWLDPATEIELRHADLCRPELLVEIEGVADLHRLADS